MKFFLCIALFVATASAGYINSIGSPLAYHAPLAVRTATIAHVAAPLAVRTAYAAPIAHVAAPLAVRTAYAAPIAHVAAPLAVRTAVAAPIATAYASPIAHVATPLATSYSAGIAAPLAYNGYGAGLYGGGLSGLHGVYPGLIKKKK